MAALTMPSSQFWTNLSQAWAREDWGVLLAGWASLGGGYWLGQRLHTVAWVDDRCRLWIDGRLSQTFSTAQSMTEQLDRWLREQSLTWQRQPIHTEASACCPNALPQGGWVVYGAYEAFRLFEPVLAECGQSDPDEWPLLVLVAFKTYHWFDPATEKQAVWQSDPYTPPACLPDGWQSTDEHLANAVTAEPTPPITPTASFIQLAFEQAVGLLLGDIEAGNLYQANLSIRFEQTVTLDPLALFAELLWVNPSPFCGVLKTPWGWLVSNSPERLVAVDRAGQVSARPIAGTRPRESDPDADTALHAELLTNPKERAEHLMLVDLARNDLGRVCQPGTVTVDELLTLEPYSHVTHLVSNVVCERAAGVSLLGVLAAVFPGGTITGCPKLRCIKALDRLEPVARTFYTGTLGWLDPTSHRMDTNILIRSARLLPASLSSHRQTQPQTWRAQFHAGAGIVADSDPVAEYHESLRKAAVMAQTLERLSQVPLATPLDAPAPAC